MKTYVDYKPKRIAVKTRFGPFRYKVWLECRPYLDGRHPMPKASELAERLKASETRVSDALVWLEENNFLKISK